MAHSGHPPHRVPSGDPRHFVTTRDDRSVSCLHLASLGLSLQCTCHVMFAIVSFECLGATHNSNVKDRKTISPSQSFNLCTFDFSFFRLVLLRLTCSWGWHRTLGTAGVIIKILQMAGVEVVLYSARLSMAPAVDCSNVIAFLQGSPNVCLGKNFKDASPMLGSGFEYVCFHVFKIDYLLTCLTLINICPQ